MTDCGHDHSFVGHAQHRADGGRLIAAFCVIFVFMIVEVIGGIISGSLALLADAAHMMTDAFALALAASAHWMSARPANRKLHFGYRRLQVLAAFVNGIALVALMSWIIYEAVRRSLSPIEVAWAPMLVIAALGLAANAIAFRLLHQAGEHNINIKGAMLHVASDLLGSIAAVIAAIVIWQTGWTRIDPILSIFVAVLIARSALKLLRETTHILLEGAPSHIDAEALATDLKSAIDEVEDIHSVKIWQLTPDQLRLTLHAKLRDGAAADEALLALKSKLEASYGIHDSTIQIEAGCACPDHDQAPEPQSDMHGHSHGRHDHTPATPPVRLRAVH
ncbi:MAG: cation diffusion facilitator family transporter [Pseudomonadota bacterium]